MFACRETDESAQMSDLDDKLSNTKYLDIFFFFTLKCKDEVLSEGENMLESNSECCCALQLGNTRFCQEAK